jgi:hypothetical protein
MKTQSLDDLGVLVKAVSPGTISGPRAIAFGIGWDPTLTFWANDRRLHLYFRRARGCLAVWHLFRRPPLVAEVSVWSAVEAERRTRQGTIRCEEDLVRVAAEHLRDSLPLDHLGGSDWAGGGFPHDPHIPHPPGDPIPGNISDLFDPHGFGDRTTRTSPSELPVVDEKWLRETLDRLTK